MLYCFKMRHFPLHCPFSRDTGQHRVSVEGRGGQPRRFSRPRAQQAESGLPSLELTWDSQGELVTSPRKRQERVSDSLTTPRYRVYSVHGHDDHIHPLIDPYLGQSIVVEVSCL